MFLLSIAAEQTQESHAYTLLIIAVSSLFFKNLFILIYLLFFGWQT